jgi:hypothetical protein
MIQKETEILVEANQKMVQLQTAQSQQIIQQSKHIADMNQKLTMFMELLLEDTSAVRRIATTVEDSVDASESKLNGAL